MTNKWGISRRNAPHQRWWVSLCWYFNWGIFLLSSAITVPVWRIQTIRTSGTRLRETQSVGFERWAKIRLRFPSSSVAGEQVRYFFNGSEWQQILYSVLVQHVLFVLFIFVANNNYFDVHLSIGLIHDDDDDDGVISSVGLLLLHPSEFLKTNQIFI